MEEIILNPIQKDALQELANIGAGHASTVLSQMINQTIHMGIPKVEIIPLSKVNEYVKEENIVVGVFLKISEELPSYVLLLIPRQSAFSLANMLQGKKPEETKEILSEIDKSALSEVSNIMICAFFDSVSELLGIPIIPSPPNLAFDIPDAVIDYVLIQIGAVSNQVVVFNVELNDEQQGHLKIHMFLLPEPQAVTKLLEKLGVK